MDHDSVKCCGFELEPDITGGLSLKGGELDGGIRLPEGDYIVQQVYKKKCQFICIVSWHHFTGEYLQQVCKYSDIKDIQLNLLVPTLNFFIIKLFSIISTGTCSYYTLTAVRGSLQEIFKISLKFLENK